MPTRRLSAALTLTLALAVLFPLAACETPTTTPTSEPRSATRTPRAATTATVSSAGAEQAARVARVVDGDTIVVLVGGREERLRYIGIDTPETVKPNSPVECFGEEASVANERLVDGQTVYLKKDISDRDRFGRLLRYVYVDDPASGERLFVNLELVARGFAQVSTFPPDVRHEAEFRAAQRAAREDGRGLWGACE